MHKSQWFIIAMVAFCCGVALGTMPQDASRALLICGGGIVFGAALFARSSWQAVFIALISIAFICGVVRGSVAQARFADTTYEEWDVRVYGVVRDVRIGRFAERVMVDVRTCVSARGSCDTLGAILVVRPLHDQPTLALRDGVAVACRIERIRSRAEDSFDYARYLAARGVYYTCTGQVVHDPAVVRAIPDKVLARLATVRRWGEETIARFIAPPASGLMAGLLFGGDDGMSRVWQDAFAATGLTHIVAVSGYNVTVIAHAVIVLLVFFGAWRTHATWGAIIAIVAFVLMIGAPASAVRAGIMGVAILLLLYIGRLGNALGALLLAVVAMLAVQPFLLWYDVGFQLSVMATLGLVILAPFFALVLRGDATGVAAIIVMTLIAQLFVAPIIAYHFHVITPLAFLANVAVLPLLPLAMAFGVAVLLAAPFVPVIALWVGWGATLLLSWVFAVVRFLRDVPGMQYEVTITLWQSALFYGILLAIIGGMYALRRDRRTCNHQAQ